ncbi:hypothetical protein [Nonomuraea sp. NPDC003201]
MVVEQPVVKTLALFVLTVFQLARTVNPLPDKPMWFAEAIILTVLIARGRVRLALPLSLVVFGVLPQGWTPSIRGWAAWATMAARDARWALAGAIYVWTGLALFQFGGGDLTWHSTRDFLYWGGSSLLVLVAFAMARRSRRVI